MKRVKKSIPNPGSKEALAKGCKCPVLDNTHGQGWVGLGSDWVGLGGHLFWISVDCLLHGNTKKGKKK